MYSHSSSLLADSSVEGCRNDDQHDAKRSYLLPSSKLCGPEVQRLKVIIDCPQPGSSRATYTVGLLHSPGGLSVTAMTRWSCSGAVRARCPKKLSRSDLTQPDTRGGDLA